MRVGSGRDTSGFLGPVGSSIEKPCHLGAVTGGVAHCGSTLELAAGKIEGEVFNLKERWMDKQANIPVSHSAEEDACR